MDILFSGFVNSCATPAVRMPIEASFFDCMISSSRWLSSSDIKFIALMTEPNSSLDLSSSIFLKSPFDMDMVIFSIALSEASIFWEIKWLTSMAEAKIAQEGIEQDFF